MHAPNKANELRTVHGDNSQHAEHPVHCRLSMRQLRLSAVASCLAWLSRSKCSSGLLDSLLCFPMAHYISEGRTCTQAPPWQQGALLLVRKARSRMRSASGCGRQLQPASVLTEPQHLLGGQGAPHE